MKHIPANLITGFLGTGKTTAIRSLLQHRPEGERWAIFINEYGMVSMDEALLEQEGVDDVSVQELAGGCFCCETAMLFKPMLVQFLRRSRPHRLIIEPSGAGHPASVLDGLRGTSFFRELLDVRSTICLVDPRDYDNPRTRQNPVFHDQVEMADIVVLNHADHRDRDCIERCRQWIESFDPPKILIAETQFGELKPEWLDLDAAVIRPPRFPDAHHAHAAQDSTAGQIAHVTLGVGLGAPQVGSAFPERLEKTPKPGEPVRMENRSEGHSACGWIFCRDEVFDRRMLQETLTAIPARRVKGIFQCADDWWSFNRSEDVMTVRRTAWRRDIRLEVIEQEATSDWNQLQEQLLNCRTSEPRVF